MSAVTVESHSLLFGTLQAADWAKTSFYRCKLHWSLLIKPTAWTLITVEAAECILHRHCCTLVVAAYLVAGILAAWDAGTLGLQPGLTWASAAVLQVVDIAAAVVVR